ncbi:pectin esterase [Reichenbachiella sp. 5M10]|uniref:pectinesterase family protein n=1 Tax=Reichenbachiella sp. 5M10 TaxID=1889772 RepID=UPI000C152D0B|nr:pectinesterase family protein [Reichenbachiella sp. 5M10]PIB34683.1 pectin esterase [Reichenbachiella sp. 5M10]
MRLPLVIALFWIGSTLGASAQADQYDFVVALDGSGDYTTVQAALDAVPDIRKAETRILIKKGVYKEKLVLAGSKTNVTLIGESVKETVLTYDDFADKLNRFGERIGTSGSSSFYVYGDGFRAENLTFENSSGPVGQAVAVRVDGDRVAFVGCRFLGYQDTLYPHGKNSRQYYKNCYIEGTTDYIFGWSTAVFEQCEIYSKTGGRYITAASTVESSAYGFVFLNCRLSGDAPKGSVYLGRPWRDYAQTVYIGCTMDEHIAPEGWHNWDKPNAESTAYYAEYESRGSGAAPDERVAWSHQLSPSEMQKYDVVTVLGGWNPNEQTTVEP